ncbi:MAG: alpha/beta fold hydrolase [bacterium]|nr:alpha/beta fold hydrolase [bacterium]
MFLETSDKVKVAYDYYPALRATGYLVLVHMMPATKESWKEFAEQASAEGFSAIAIDLRGHGQSQSGPNGYEAFADEEHQQSMKDLEAAVEFLKTQGASPENITLIGASIGANLCLWFLAEHPEFKKAVLLSAGESYRGIKAPPLLVRLSAGQSLLMFASEDDIRNGASNADINKRLAEAVPEKVNKKLVVYPTGGHGTAYLEKAVPVILDFLKT